MKKRKKKNQKKIYNIYIYIFRLRAGFSEWVHGVALSNHANHKYSSMVFPTKKNKFSPSFQNQRHITYKNQNDTAFLFTFHTSLSAIFMRMRSYALASRDVPFSPFPCFTLFYQEKSLWWRNPYDLIRDDHKKRLKKLARECNSHACQAYSLFGEARDVLTTQKTYNIIYIGE